MQYLSSCQLDFAFRASSLFLIPFMILFLGPCGSPILFRSFSEQITSERRCLKAHISLMDCSILNLKIYTESANESLFSLYNHFWIMMFHCVISNNKTELNWKCDWILYRSHSMRLVVGIAMVSLVLCFNILVWAIASIEHSPKKLEESIFDLPWLGLFYWPQQCST